MEVVVMPGIEAVGWTNRLGGRQMDLNLGALCATMSWTIGIPWVFALYFKGIDQ
jgi:hypothetical protein